MKYPSLYNILNIASKYKTVELQRITLKIDGFKY